MISNGPKRASLVGSILFVAASCGTSHEHKVVPTDASEAGISHLFEQECFDWRSYDWAKEKYLAAREECQRGAIISESDAANCLANVTSIEWQVPITANQSAPANLDLDYFFDETPEPTLADATCIIKIGKELSADAISAAQTVAKSQKLIGPFKAGEHGLSTPTLQQFWMNSENRPVIGIFAEQDGGIKMVRYHANMRPLSPNE